MNNKGFTLAELIAVIVLVVVITLITVPSINTAITQSRESSYLKQVDMVESAAKKWGVENDQSLPDITSTEIITIDFNTLHSLGYLKQKKIINPKTEEELTGCVKVSYDTDYNQYEYKYTDNLTECDNYNINNK